MGDVLVKKITEDIDKHLDGYRELMAKRAEVEARLRRAEKEKQTVKEAIFERVTREYIAEIEKLEQDIEPLRDKVDKIRHDLDDGHGELNAEIKKTEEEIEEMSFRRRIGEYDESQFAERVKPLRERIEGLNAQAEELKKLLAQIEGAERGDDDESDLALADAEDDAEVDGDIPLEPTWKAAAGSASVSEASTTSESTTDPDAKSAAESPADRDATRASESGSTGGAPDTAAENHDSTDSATASETATDTIDTSGWAEELQRDMERTVHIRNRRATDDPVGEVKPVAEDAGSAKPRAGGGAKKAQPADNNVPTAFPNLVITKGPGAGKKLPLIPVTMTVGREHDNNIELKDMEVSRYHSRISFSNGEYRIQDLDSSSGTWINGEKVTEAVLKHGDKITVGTTEMLIDFD